MEARFQPHFKWKEPPNQFSPPPPLSLPVVDGDRGPARQPPRPAATISARRAAGRSRAPRVRGDEPPASLRRRGAGSDATARQGGGSVPRPASLAPFAATAPAGSPRCLVAAAMPRPAQKSLKWVEGSAFSRRVGTLTQSTPSSVRDPLEILAQNDGNIGVNCLQYSKSTLRPLKSKP